MGKRLNFAIAPQANYQCNAFDDRVNVDTLLGAVDITLPQSNGIDTQNGSFIWIRHAVGANPCKIVPFTGDGTTINLTTEIFLQPTQLVKLVLFDGNWTIEYSNMLPFYYPWFVVRSGSALTVSFDQMLLGLHKDHDSWTIESITYTFAQAGGRGTTSIRLLQNGVTNLGQVNILEGVLCQTLAINASHRACDHYRLQITAIPSPAPLGLFAVMKVRPT